MEKFKVLNEISPNRFGPLFHKLVICTIPLDSKNPSKREFLSKKWGLIQERPKNWTFNIIWGFIQERGSIKRRYGMLN